MQSPIFQLFFGLIMVTFIGLVSLNYSKSIARTSIVEGSDLSESDLISIVEYIEQTAILQRNFSHIEMLKRGITPTEKNGYFRYYSVSVTDKGTFVIGMYLQGPIRRRLGIPDEYRLAGTHDVYIVPHDFIPIVNDGGCGVLTVTYNVENSTLLEFNYEHIVEARYGKKPEADEGPFVYHAFCNGIG